MKHTIAVMFSSFKVRYVKVNHDSKMTVFLGVECDTQRKITQEIEKQIHHCICSSSKRVCVKLAYDCFSVILAVLRVHDGESFSEFEHELKESRDPFSKWNLRRIFFTSLTMLPYDVCFHFYRSVFL